MDAQSHLTFWSIFDNCFIKILKLDAPKVALSLKQLFNNRIG